NTEKAEKNIRKHGVSFQEALTVFQDALSLIVYHIS
ncbi:MAG: BrnT family toxin, partial [Planctomycetes bacterium]|nr:BrnT family toxin [Planctomycetota bacterium]